MAITVLLIDRNIPFIVSLKQALEGTGDFRVTLAANPGAADEALRFGNANIAVVDFDLPDMDVMELIRLLRSIQPDLPILLTPENDLQTERAQFMDVQGTLIKPYTARDLIPRVQQIVERSGTAELPPREELDFLAIDDSMPFDLGDQDGGDIFDLDQLEIPAADLSSPEGILEEFETMERAQTGLLYSEDEIPANWQTRVFEDDGWAPGKPWNDEWDAADAGTRIFEDVIDSDYPTRTRAFEDFTPDPSDTTTLPDSAEQPETRTLKDTEELRKKQTERKRSSATRPLVPMDDGSYDADDFGPVNPFVDIPGGGDTFDDVLDAVTPPKDRERSSEDQAFHDLVDSMRTPPRPKSHATRLEALLSSIAHDFNTEPPTEDDDTLDYVLDAIRQGRSPVTPAPRKMTDDSDDTTIGDVIDGLFDPAFEGVLAALAGEQIDESEIEEPTYEHIMDADDDLLAVEGDSAAGGEPRESRYGEGSEGGEPYAPVPGESAAPGQLIFEPPVTSEDSSKYPATTALSAVSDIESGSFSLDELLSQIEEQLPPVHTRKPRLKPLPSWKRDGLLDKESGLADMFDRVEGTTQAPERKGKLPSTFAEPGEKRPAAKAAEPPVTLEDTTPSSAINSYRGVRVSEFGIEEYEPAVEPLAQDEIYADVAPPPEYDDDFEPEPDTEDTASEFDQMDLLSLDELMARADLPPEAADHEIARDRHSRARQHDDQAQGSTAIDLDDIIIEPTDAEIEAAFYDGLQQSSFDTQYSASDLNAPVDLEAELLDDLLDDQVQDEYDDAVEGEYDAYDDEYDDEYEEEYEVDRTVERDSDLPYALPAARQYDLADDLPDDLPEDMLDGMPDDLPEFVPEPLALDDTDLAWFEEVGDFVIPDSEHLIEMPVDEATQRIEAAIVQEDEQEEDVAIAQLAVQLTQYSLESSAQATLLSQNGDLIAYAGDADEDIIEGIFKKIYAAWNSTTIESDSLIRFVSLPQDGEYLVYSTRLTNDRILSMAFHASTSLSTIRRQAARLSESLDLVPDTDAEDIAEAVVDYADVPPAAQTKPSRPTEIKPLRKLAEQMQSAPPPRPAPEEPIATYTALWMPNDPGLEIHDVLADAIEQRIAEAAEPQKWSVSEVIAQSDYVSLTLRAPQKLSPDSVIDELMASTSEYIAETFPQIGSGGPLWANGYYLVTPSRTLTDREIMRIMTVQRNAQLSS